MILHSDFVPAPMLGSPHLQTILANKLTAVGLPFSLRRETLELRDGDFVHLDWTPRRDGPLVLVLHGLGGSHRSRYVAALLRAVHQAGWRAVLMRYRGSSGVVNRHARGHHAGATDDLGSVVDHLTRHALAPLAVVGFSLGGNLLLKYLGEQGDNSKVGSAIAVSVPFDLHDAAATMSTGRSRIYQHAMLQETKRRVREKLRGGLLPHRYASALKARTFLELDNRLTGPLHGFADALDYYRQCSCRQWLRHIQTPTLIIHAADDPFMTRAAIPGAGELSESVTLELAEHGGHVGFLAGDRPWRVHRWLEPHIVQWLRQVLGGTAPDDAATYPGASISAPAMAHQESNARQPV